MNTLLIFFAFPVAVIIISAILEKILKNPIAVAELIFAIFLIVTFAAFDETFLIATLVYTIIAFTTAFIVSLLKHKNRNEREENTLCELLVDFIRRNSENNNCGNNNNESLADTVEDILSNNTSNNSNSNINNCSCGRNRYRRW